MFIFTQKKKKSKLPINILYPIYPINKKYNQIHKI